jgi:hypothetical protein
MGFVDFYLEYLQASLEPQAQSATSIGMAAETALWKFPTIPKEHELARQFADAQARIKEMIWEIDRRDELISSAGSPNLKPRTAGGPNVRPDEP